MPDSHTPRNPFEGVTDFFTELSRMRVERVEIELYVAQRAAQRSKRWAEHPA